ncbi:MAG: hypothetical protein WBF83_07475 [Moheibacter sp.]
MTARKEQENLMKDFLTRNKSTFLAVTGRRRVGKTYLIDEVFKKYFCLRITGIQNADLQTQINNFTQKTVEYSGLPIVTPPSNWQEVFLLLKTYLKTLPKNRKQEFINKTKTKKTVFNTLITAYGTVKNEYYLDVIDNELTVSDLMK